MLRRGLLGAVAACCLAAPAPALATVETAMEIRAVEDIGRMSLEELANLEITSVSKRPERLGDAAAAVFVISNADIRRSGAVNVPEALRLAPNLHVTRINAVAYAISARGFNSFQSANKLLVLIDGRSVYTPLFSGVLWEVQTVMLEDVERIEVISGPGGTLWGANAVNGVINIITRKAQDTQGGLVSAVAGETDTQLSARYGGALGESGAWRVYATGFRREEMLLLNGAGAGDHWDGAQAGFRTDWSHASDTFTIQGDVYKDRTNSLVHLLNADGRLTGANLTAGWTHAFSPDSSVSVLAYYDHAKRTSPGLADTLETYNLEGQHSFRFGERHQLVWGGGYRQTEDEFYEDSPFYSIDPPRERVTLANLFVQDQVSLAQSLSLTLGLKLEDSSFAGQEWLPSAHLAWRPSERTMLWAGASRATRTPSRIERGFSIPGFGLTDTFQSESVVAYEAGYRGRLSEQMSLSVSAFYNVYDGLRTNEFTGGKIAVLNGIEGETYGVEIWGRYDVTDWWRLTAGLATLEKNFEVKDGRADLAGMLSTGNDPDYNAQIRSQMDLPAGVEVDLALRAVDELPNPATKSYVDADARLGWQMSDTVELSLVGHNLLHEAHSEIIEPPFVQQVRRSVSAGLRWSF